MYLVAEQKHKDKTQLSNTTVMRMHQVHIYNSS